MAECPISEFSRKRCLLHLQKQIVRQIIANQKLYILNPMRIQRKKHQYGTLFAQSNKEKNKAVCKICKVPSYFYIHCTFGFGFSIWPRARCFSGLIFGFGLKWKTYFWSFTGNIHLRVMLCYL